MLFLPSALLVVIGGLVALGLFRLRYGWSCKRWMRAIRFAPRGEMSAAQLFGCLLSANLALLEHDNFNQFESALPAKRIRAILAAHWDIHSAESCGRIVFGRLRNLGCATLEEQAAFSAWADGASLDSRAFASLHGVCRFLSNDAQVVPPHRLLGHRFSMMAWDIQQVAYMTRLGFTAGYVSRRIADHVFGELQRHARRHCHSWNDYSLSMLVGMGVRSPVDQFDIGGWFEFARSHTVLTGSRETLLRHAAPWDPAVQAASAASTSRVMEAGVSSGA